MSEHFLSSWKYRHSWLLLITSIITVFTGWNIPLVVLSAVSFFILLFSARSGLRKFIPWGGYANYVTAARFLILGIAGILNSTDLIVLLAATALLLDAADGYLARKFNQESSVGALFDLEVDAFYVLMLSLLIWQSGLLSLWILFPASLRYLYVIIVQHLQVNPANDRRTRFGPAIAGLHFVALLMPFLLPLQVYLPVCIITSVLVSLSFIYSAATIFNIDV